MKVKLWLVTAGDEGQTQKPILKAIPQIPQIVLITFSVANSVAYTFTNHFQVPLLQKEWLAGPGWVVKYFCEGFALICLGWVLELVPYDDGEFVDPNSTRARSPTLACHT